MRTWTWKHWTITIVTLGAVAGLAYGLGSTLGAGDAAIIAEPTAPDTAEPTVAPTATGPAAPDPTVSPTSTAPAAEPSPSEAPTHGATTWMVTTDGDDVVLRSHRGGDAVTLYASPAGAETSVSYVAVMPGSSPQELTVVFTRSGEGMRGGTEGNFDLWYATITDRSRPAAQPFPDAHQVSPDTDPSSHPYPVWSPDGRHLAWTELSADGRVILRTIGWSDGPGTGDAHTDNASFALDDLPAVPTTVEEWVWNGEGDATTGSLVVTSDELGAHRVGVERQAGGALARPAAGGIHAMPHPDGPVIDQADGRIGPTPETSAIYTLVAAGGTDGTVDLQLTVIEGADQSEDLPVPEELERTSDPGSRWMVAEAATVLVGDGGGTAWLIHRNGEIEVLGGTVVSGDLVG